MKRILPPAFARSYGVAGPRRAVALSVGGLVSLLLAAISGYSPAATARQRGESESRFDAAPFGLPLPEGNGVMWEDPREIYEVIVHFSGAPPRSGKIRLEYWGSRWPEQHLPKDRQPGGADVGWMELGNWYNGACAWLMRSKNRRFNSVFHLRAVNAKEFPALKDYAAAFRYTLKIRLASDQPLPTVELIEAFTDSMWKADSARLEWAQRQANQSKCRLQRQSGERAEHLPRTCAHVRGSPAGREQLRSEYI